MIVTTLWARLAVLVLVQVRLQAPDAHSLPVVVLLQEQPQARRERQLLHSCDMDRDSLESVGSQAECNTRSSAYRRRRCARL